MTGPRRVRLHLLDRAVLADVDAPAPRDARRARRRASPALHDRRVQPVGRQRQPRAPAARRHQHRLAHERRLGRVERRRPRRPSCSSSRSALAVSPSPHVLSRGNVPCRRTRRAGPRSAAVIAAAVPAGPAPTTTTSTGSAIGADGTGPAGLSALRTARKDPDPADDQRRPRSRSGSRRRPSCGWRVPGRPPPLGCRTIIAIKARGWACSARWAERFALFGLIRMSSRNCRKKATIAALVRRAITASRCTPCIAPTPMTAATRNACASAVHEERAVDARARRRSAHCRCTSHATITRPQSARRRVPIATAADFARCTRQRRGSKSSCVVSEPTLNSAPTNDAPSTNADEQHRDTRAFEHVLQVLADVRPRVRLPERTRPFSSVPANGSSGSDPTPCCRDLARCRVGDLAGLSGPVYSWAVPVAVPIVTAANDDQHRERNVPRTIRRAKKRRSSASSCLTTAPR